MKKVLFICIVFIVFLGSANQTNIFAAPPQKQIIFTQTTDTPADPSICPNSSQRLAAFCPFGTVLVSGQCSIDPPIPHLQGTPNFIQLKPEIHPDLDTGNEHGVDVESAAHFQCTLKCNITDTGQPVPIIPNDAVIIATVLCAGTPIQ